MNLVLSFDQYLFNTIAVTFQFAEKYTSCEIWVKWLLFRMPVLISDYLY